MLGAYDFCGHYEWTFAWLAAKGGENLLHEYWDEAIHRDSQCHASELILAKGIEGMKEYWGHSLAQEAAGYQTTVTDKVFRIDMYECPSKGFLLRNHLEQHPDYCDHCLGWIGPLMKRAGYVINHEHNHRGQCWWEMLQAPLPSDAPGALAGADDVRLRADWDTGATPIDVYRNATGPEEKCSSRR